MTKRSPNCLLLSFDNGASLPTSTSKNTPQQSPRVTDLDPTLQPQKNHITTKSRETTKSRSTEGRFLEKRNQEIHLEYLVRAQEHRGRSSQAAANAGVFLSNPFAGVDLWRRVPRRHRQHRRRHLHNYGGAGGTMKKGDNIEM